MNLKRVIIACRQNGVGAVASMLPKLVAQQKMIARKEDLHFLSDMLMDANRYMDAVHVLELIQERYGLCDAGSNNLGYCLDKCNRKDEAITAYKKSLAQNPSNLSSLRNLAMLEGDVATNRLNFEKRKDYESWAWYVAATWNSEAYDEFIHAVELALPQWFDDPECRAFFDDLLRSVSGDENLPNTIRDRFDAWCSRTAKEWR